MPGWRLAAAQCAIKHRAQFQRMINQHIGAPMGRIVVRMNVAPADGGGAGAGGAAGFDIAQVIADEEDFLRLQPQLLAGQPQRIGNSTA